MLHVRARVVKVVKVVGEWRVCHHVGKDKKV